MLVLQSFRDQQQLTREDYIEASVQPSLIFPPVSCVHVYCEPFSKAFFKHYSKYIQLIKIVKCVHKIDN